MTPYPDSFWRHTVEIVRRPGTADADLGPVLTPQTPFSVRANVQDAPKYSHIGKGREEVHGGVQSSRGWQVYLEPTIGMPAIEADDTLIWINQGDTITLIAMAKPTDRGGYGVALLLECIDTR